MKTKMFLVTETKKGVFSIGGVASTKKAAKAYARVLKEVDGEYISCFGGGIEVFEVPVVDDVPEKGCKWEAHFDKKGKLVGSHLVRKEYEDLYRRRFEKTATGYCVTVRSRVKWAAERKAKAVMAKYLSRRKR